VVPPCDELPDPPEPDFFPPLLEAPGLLAIRAARSFDMPLSFSASYCFSFFTEGRLFGIASSFFHVLGHYRWVHRIRPQADAGRNAAHAVLAIASVD
jgi:hypothetical protein